MEPSYDGPRITPEQSPSLPPVTPEVVPGSFEPQLEQAPQPFEREPLPQEASVTQPQQTMPALPQPVVSVVDDDDATAALLTALPDVAADDDLIEKEWVNKAKHIIAETADDPHAREQAISQLQKEYLRKRYGKEVGVSE